MGYMLIDGKFSASLSRHNSLKDIRHDDLWNDFVSKIQMLANNPKYKEINLIIDASEID